MQGCLYGQDLTVDLELQRRHRLVEEPVPGLRSRDRFLEEQLLDLFVELVRLGFAQLVEPVAVAGEIVVHRERRIEHVVADPVELELPEQEPRRQIRDRLAEIAEELELNIKGCNDEVAKALNAYQTGRLVTLIVLGVNVVLGDIIVDELADECLGDVEAGRVVCHRAES